MGGGGGCAEPLPIPTTSARVAEWGQEDRAELGGTRRYRGAALGVHQPRQDWTVGRGLKLAGRNLATLPLIHELPWGDALAADGR